MLIQKLYFYDYLKVTAECLRKLTDLMTFFKQINMKN